MRLEPARVGLQHGSILIIDGVVVVAEMNVAERTASPDGPVLPVLGGISPVSSVLVKLICVGIRVADRRRFRLRATRDHQHHHHARNRHRHRLGQCRTTIHPTTPTMLDKNHCHYPPSMRKLSSGCLPSLYRFATCIRASS